MSELVDGLGALGKTAHFSGTETPPFVIAHTAIKLGAQPRRKGLVCEVAESTHTRTGSKTKGKKTNQADPLLAAQAQAEFPWRVGQCL